MTLSPFGYVYQQSFAFKEEHYFSNLKSQIDKLNKTRQNNFW